MGTILAAAFLVSTEAFAPVVNQAPISATALNAVGLFFSTSTGNTETDAGYLGEAAGGLEAMNIADAETDAITGADDCRSGTDWDDWLYDTLPDLELDGKPVAIFGCGDQSGYADNYCDAAGELYDLFTAKGCKVFGMTSQEGYEHTESKAIRDEKFVGLMFDEDNQYDMSEDRAKAWVAQLKEEGFPL